MSCVSICNQSFEACFFLYKSHSKCARVMSVSDQKILECVFYYAETFTSIDFLTGASQVNMSNFLSFDDGRHDASLFL